jgi:hypothetical protein
VKEGPNQATKHMEEGRKAKKRRPSKVYELLKDKHDRHY